MCVCVLCIFPFTSYKTHKNTHFTEKPTPNGQLFLDILETVFFLMTSKQPHY